MIIVRFATFITVFLLSCYGWAGPSFNCSKATTKIEHAICGANMLSEYDNLMGKMYRELKNISEVKKSQRDWIKKRNTQCLSADVDCLADLYRTRLLELDKYYSPSDKNGEYVMTGGDREITVTLLSSNNLIQVNLFGAGGKGSTCDFDGTGELNSDEAVVRNNELSEDGLAGAFKQKLTVSTPLQSSLMQTLLQGRFRNRGFLNTWLRLLIHLENGNLLS